MKYLALIIFSILFSHSSYSQTDTTTRKWYYIDSTITGDRWYHYYKPISKEDEKIKIWIKIKTKNYEFEGDPYPNAYIILLAIIDCKNQLIKVTSSTTYQYDGKVLEANNFEDAKFNVIYPESISETAANEICRNF